MSTPPIRLVAGYRVVAVALAVVWVGGCKTGKNDDAAVAPPGSDHHAEPGTTVGSRGKPDLAEPHRSVEDVPDASRCEGRPVETIEDNYPTGALGRRREVVKLDDDTYVSHGVLTLFWEDGESKKAELEFVCGVRHGQSQTWYETGEKRGLGQYVNGREHGEWTQWAPNGALMERHTMDHGAWHGTFTQWYANGQKRMEVEWVRGRRQGPEIYWDEDGNEVKRIQYHDGVPQPLAGPKP